MLDLSTRCNVPSTAATDEGMASLTACEHLMLLRRLGCLQQQMTAMVRSYEVQLDFWGRQLMRQSVRLMLERTRADWHLLPGWQPARLSGTASSALRASEPDADLSRMLASAHTDALICRTGCKMDGDHWLDGELCKRDGRVCAMGVSVDDVMPKTG